MIWNFFQGLEKIKAVVSDTGEPLIDPTYGHGG